MSARVRISDLIEALREWHERYGDCPVFVEDADGRFRVEVEAVEFDSGWGGVALMVETGWDE
ncbi:MAG: hypothetical protein ACRDQB_08320 [Thermocrispum sp.]